jgi:hypothetical protein
VPRIPQIVQDQPLQGSGLSIGAAEAPGLAAAHVGEQAADIGTQMLQKQIQLQELNDFGQRRSDALLAIDAAVTTQQQDPNFRSQPERVDAAIKAITVRALADVRSPEVKAHLQVALDNQRELELIDARAFARTKEIDYGHSVFDSALEASRTRLAGMTGLEYAQELAARKGLADGAVKVGLYTHEQMQVKMGNWLDGVTEDSARIAGLVDPVTTANQLVSGNEYNDLNPTHRLELAQQMLNEHNRRQTEDEKQVKRWQAVNYSDLVTQMAQGKDVSDQLIKAGPSGTGEIDLEQQVTGLKLNSAAATELGRPGNPATLQRLSLDVYSSNPKTTEREIDGAVIDHNLTLKEGVELKARLVSTRRALQDAARSNPQLVRDQAQAEQLLNSALTTKSPFEALDPVSQKLKTQGLLELTRRSSLFPAEGGTENPLRVVEDLIPRLQKGFEDQGRLEADQIGKLLLYPDQQQLDAAYAQGKVNDGTYTSQYKLLRDLEARNQDIAIMKERRAATDKSGTRPKY